METKEYYGDSQVDIYLLEIFEKTLKSQQNYFVDVGANDGVTGSNTYLLEKKGWHGLLVEPNTAHREKLSQIRTSPVEHSAISESDKVTFNTVTGPSNLHGLSRIDTSGEFVTHIKKHGGNVQALEVPAMTLTKLFEKHDVPKDLEILSVDVEGHEITVFRTLDFNLYHPQVIITEDNSKGRNSEVRDFLNSKGYTLVNRISVNEIYVQNKDSSKFVFSKLKTNLKYKRWQSKYFFKRLFKIEDQNNYV